MRRDAVAEAREAGAAADDRAADAVVVDAHEERAVLAECAHGDLRRRGVLDGVRERLARDEVGGRLDARGDPLARRVDVDRDRRRAREVAQRGGEAVVEPRRAHAGRDLAEVADRGADLVDDLVERGGEHLRLARKRHLQAPEPDAERDEPLLRAVVEVALEPPPLLVARLDDPRPRRGHLGELDPHFDPQPRHLDRERRGREDAVEQVAPLEQRRVVEQQRRAGVVAPDLAPARARPRWLAGLPVASAYASVSGSQKKLGERVAERVGEHGADLLRRAPPVADVVLEGPDELHALVARAAEAAVDDVLDARPQRPERNRDGERRDGDDPRRVTADDTPRPTVIAAYDEQQQGRQRA